MRKQLASRLLPIVFFALLAPMADAQLAVTSPDVKLQAARVNAGVAPKICDRCIRAHEEFLASDAMQGRGSGTHDELVAATYVASELRQYGIEPAGNNGSYIQQAPTIQRKIISPPQLRITPTGGDPSSEPITLGYGKDFLVLFLTQTEFSGPLQKLDADKADGPGKLTVERGAFALISGSDSSKVRTAAFSVASQGAAAILVLAPDSLFKDFEGAGKQMPKMADRLKQDSGQEMTFNVLNLNRDAFHSLEQMPDGVMVRFRAQASDENGYTWNAIGILHGSDSLLQHGAI
jgi:aminopeptidase YwaD